MSVAQLKHANYDSYPLSAQLTNSNIKAQLNYTFQAGVNGNDLVAHYFLVEESDPLEKYGNVVVRVPGAAVDRSIADQVAAGNLGLQAWVDECHRAHRAICEYFEIDKMSILVNDQNVIYALVEGAGYSCRWVPGFGWVGW